MPRATAEKVRRNSAILLAEQNRDPAAHCSRILFFLYKIMNVTIKDIAAAAGISRGTVDRVLHNRSGVNPEVAKRVKEIADKMGFVPNKAGKILAARKQKITFAYLLPSSAKPFFDEVLKGVARAEKELSDYGVTVDTHFFKDFKTETHIKEINKIAESGYTGLCITSLDTPEVQLAVHKLVENGIPVVSVNTDVPDSGRICYVGTDYLRAGKTAAGMANFTTDGNLNILFITGSYNIRGHKERIKGFTEGLDSRSVKYTVIDTIEAQDDDECAYQKSVEYLTKNPDINCIFIAGSGCAGVCRAMNELNRKDVNVIAFDEVPAIKEYMHSGLLKFTIGQEPELQGYMGIQRLFSWLMEEGKRTSSDYITQTIIKIQENIAE